MILNKASLLFQLFTQSIGVIVVGGGEAGCLRSVEAELRWQGRDPGHKTVKSDMPGIVSLLPHLTRYKQLSATRDISHSLILSSGFICSYNYIWISTIIDKRVKAPSTYELFMGAMVFAF